MTQPKSIAITRRKLLLAGAAVPLCAILTRPAAAAEFTYKLATGQDPTHPVNVRAKEAADRIREATSGRLEINLFPANQLGSDTDLLTQIWASFSPTMMRCGRRWMAILARTSVRRSQKRRS